VREVEWSPSKASGGQGGFSWLGERSIRVTGVEYLADSKVSDNLGAISPLSPGHLAPRFPETFESAK